MPTKTYYKLVRDRIPEIIEADGKRGTGGSAGGCTGCCKGARIDTGGVCAG